MFTGIVTEVGHLAAIERSGAGARLSVRCDMAAAGLDAGESIAVAGVCLTVESSDARLFRCTASPETMRRTSLAGCGAGAAVNLERSLRLGDRLGGHFVHGHVDGVAPIRARREEGVSRVLTIAAPADLLPYLVERGSVAVDGVSLTVTAVLPAAFEVTLIPATLEGTTFGARRVGDAVNLEVDMLSRYVARWLDAGAAPGRIEAGRWLAGPDED
jgi:riboflavin synthase